MHTTSDTLPGSLLTQADREANGADLHVTLADLRANAASAIPELQEQQQLDKPAYPDEPAAVPPDFRRETLGDRFANLWANMRAAMLRREIRNNLAFIGRMPAAVERQREEAKRDYELRLDEINAEAAFHSAEAELDIQRATAKLARMGYDA